MSFDVFLQRFVGGKPAEVTEKVCVRYLSPHQPGGLMNTAILL